MGQGSPEGPHELCRAPQECPKNSGIVVNGLRSHWYCFCARCVVAAAPDSKRNWVIIALPMSLDLAPPPPPPFGSVPTNTRAEVWT